MNLADNISYSLHDLEDALSLGMINLQDWNSHFSEENSFELFNDFIEKVSSIHETSNYSYQNFGRKFIWRKF